MFELLTPQRKSILCFRSDVSYPVIVGEAPGPNSDPDRPFCGASGIRLAEWAGLSGFEELERRAHLRNVLDEWPGQGYAGEKGSRFPPIPAKSAAASMRFPLGAVVLFAGARVADAFGFRKQQPKPFRWHRFMRGEGGGPSIMAAWMPHPSGTCRTWNERKNVLVARKFLREMFPTARSIAAWRDA